MNKVKLDTKRILNLALRFERWAEDTMYDMQKPGLIPRLKELKAEHRDEYLFVAQMLREKATTLEIREIQNKTLEAPRCATEG